MPPVKPIEQFKDPGRTDGVVAPHRSDRRTVWEWNIPLLVVSTSLGVLICAVLVGLYFWQSQRLAEGLWHRAVAAERAEDAAEQVRWLTRYVGLVPQDVDAQIKLALAVDSLVSTPANLDQSRRRLSAALIACGENPAYEQQKGLLRGKLIQRLLQFGPLWASEAQRQVLALDAPAGDAQATKWLAQALVLQQGASRYQPPASSPLDQDQDHWSWLVEQPLGEVLHIALEANPDDVDLATSFLVACEEHREWFNTSDHPADGQRLDRLATLLVERLQKQTHDGHAQLIAYAHLRTAASPEAARVIEQAVEPALDRLAAHAKTVADDADSATPTSPPAVDGSASLVSLAIVSPPLSSAAYHPYWDWQLAAEAAQLFNTDFFSSGQDQPRAKQIYERLLACDSEAISPTQREATYVAYGSLLAAMDGLPAAIEQWQLGAELLPESLELSRLLASAYTSQQEPVQARAHVDRYQAIVESQRERLDGSYGARLDSATKQSIRHRLDSANWEVRLLQASLALAENNLPAASDLALQAFNSPLVLDTAQRLQAGKLLADSYAKRELWDMAGQTLDRCVSLAPNDAALRRRSAVAWRNAGTSEFAGQQLEKLDDGSFEAALEIARFADIEQASKPPGQADWPKVTQAIQLARQRYDQASAEARSSMKIWLLELMELRFLAADAAPADASQLRLDRLEQIALSNPQAAELQMLAAATLAASGRQAASQLALERLQELATASGLSQDRANLALTQASLRSTQNDLPGALQQLRTAMHNLPDQQLQLAKAGAEVALRSRQPRLAYELIREVPDAQLDTQALFTLCSVIQTLQALDRGQASEFTTELQRWTDRLKNIEGEEGTHWRLLQAQQLLATSSPNASNRDAQLNQATRLFREIDARRPHWGRAAALGGQIAALKGSPDEAIKLLRRAIDNGDRQINTIWSLVQQLRIAGRIDEASQELERMSGNVNAFLPMSAMLVDLAQLQGDFDGALTTARELAQEQPREHSSWLLLASTALKAAHRSGIDPEDKLAKLDEGWRALDKAQELSQGKDAHVWNARFRFRLATGDLQAAEQELIELQKSDLEHEPRLLAAGTGYLQLNNLGKARELFDGCLAINPKSTAAYLGLADLYNRLGDTAASLDALRRAQAASPENQILRERLAVALAFGDMGETTSAGKYAAEIDSLLADAKAESTPRTRMVKALIYLFQGTPQQQEQALLAMRDAARPATAEGTDAKRILASYYARRWLANSSSSGATETDRNFLEGLSYFDGLIQAAKPDALDVARYANFMFKAFEVERDAGRQTAAQKRLADTQRALQKLENITGSSVASLQLGVRLAIAQGKQDEIESLTARWVQGAGELGELEQRLVWELAAETLADLGLVEDSIVWLEKIHQQDPSKYQPLVVALAKAQQVERAAKLSVAGYHSSPSAEAATLIAEVVMLLGTQPASTEVEQALRDASVKFSDSPQFLEAFATVRLMQERFQEAAVWFEAVEKLAPGRIRTLNNWAMALVELPMGKELALQKIEKAVAVHGRFPELLDTLGLVLLRNGRLNDAQKVLAEATDRSGDPRFKLHLAQVALDRGDASAAQSAWQTIDKARLVGLVLTSAERATLTNLENADQKESK